MDDDGVLVPSEVEFAELLIKSRSQMMHDGQGSDSELDQEFGGAGATRMLQQLDTNADYKALCGPAVVLSCGFRNTGSLSTLPNARGSQASSLCERSHRGSFHNALSVVRSDTRKRMPLRSAPHRPLVASGEFALEVLEDDRGGLSGGSRRNSTTWPGGEHCSALPERRLTGSFEQTSPITLATNTAHCGRIRPSGPI